MGKVLLSPLLLLILMVIILGDSGTLGAIPEEGMCFKSDDMVIKDGDLELIKGEIFTEPENEMDLYFLKNEDNLMDVRIMVNGETDNQQEVSLDEECFQHEVQPKWQLLQVWSTLMDGRIIIGVSSENYLCQKSCLINGPWQLPLSICVMTSTSSRWKLSWPSNCPSNFPLIARNLTESSHSACKNTGSNLLFPVAIVILVVVVVGLVVFMVVVYKNRCLQQPRKSSK